MFYNIEVFLIIHKSNINILYIFIKHQNILVYLPNLSVRPGCDRGSFFKRGIFLLLDRLLYLS